MMKLHSLLTAAGLLLAAPLTTHAQLSIPSDGSDGAFNPVTDVEIDLGLALTGAWDSPGAGNGVYDPNQWAVVFKFTSINIPNNVTVTFKNHPTYAPVVWLVQGNVTIDGEVNLDGEDRVSGTIERLTPREPGPGGFRGGVSGTLGSGGGFGPGGRHSDAGLYADRYGNPQIIPLIGGSGGYPDNGASGAGAGGALLLVAQAVTLDGLISAEGGGNGDVAYRDARASGGAIRIVAGSIAGSGELSAVNQSRNGQLLGRIRIETPSLSAGIRTAPETIAVAPANPPVLWPSPSAPTAKVISVDAIAAPADPTAPLIAGADVAIQNSDPVSIRIQTENFPIEGQVQLFVIPKFGVRSTFSATRISGDITQAVWEVQTTLPQGFVVLQARATQP